jgi:hypothetical protein
MVVVDGPVLHIRAGGLAARVRKVYVIRQFENTRREIEE